MNPQVSIDRILTFQSYFIAVGSVSEPGLHQSISWISAGESIHQPTNYSNRWFHFTGIGLRSNKTVTWPPKPDVLRQAHTELRRRSYGRLLRVIWPRQALRIAHAQPNRQPVQFNLSFTSSAA